MRIFIAFSALLAVASASSLYLAPGSLVAPAVASQYHAQDGIGQYAYGYNDHLSSKHEVKSLNGVTQGSYSYIDSNNGLQSVDYVADGGGFRVAATNLPKPVQAPVVPTQNLPKQVEDSPEVALAKSVHFAAIEEAKKQSGNQAVLIQAPTELPKQVEDTPEVAAAKAYHFAAIEEAKKHNAEVVVIPIPIELPQQVEDTPEVAKAKVEHLNAIEQAKLRTHYQNNNNKVIIVQGASQHQSQPQYIIQVPQHSQPQYPQQVIASYPTQPQYPQQVIASYPSQQQQQYYYYLYYYYYYTPKK